MSYFVDLSLNIFELDYTNGKKILTSMLTIEDVWGIIF